MIKFLFLYLLAINILSFSLIFIDKRKAIKNKWRISENTLIFMALIGGALGSLLGMYLFRHKTKHKKFTIGVPFLLIVNIFFIILLLNK